MGDLEKFLHDRPQRTPALLKAALAHVQFETIHPFLDGNGRLGRLLITFILYKEGILSEPLLYISLYFKTHRKEYYDLLQTVRMWGDWEAWLRFFFQGVKETSEQAIQTASRLTSLFQNDRVKIQTLGRAASSALRVHHELQKRPIITIPTVEELTGLSTPTVSASMKRLLELGLLKEIKTSQTRRFFSYNQYLEILREGTEPIR
jgi:Fic family protein